MVSSNIVCDIVSFLFDGNRLYFSIIFYLKSYMLVAMRKVFFSFDWDDVWQVNQVRNSWVTKGNYTSAGFVDSAEIEQLKRSTDRAIKNWIAQQLQGTSVTCVLIGENTSNSRWVNYEIQKSIGKVNGLVGICIHKIKDRFGNIAAKGASPFANPPINFVPMSSDSLSYPCCSYYDWINDNGYENLGVWIEKEAQQANR